MFPRSKISFIIAVVILFLASSYVEACTAPSCTKIIDNGADAGKKIVVVMGDGYTTAEQADYNQQVADLVTDGMFGNEFFEEMQNAFNVYRLNLNSTFSGLSQRNWDLNGTPNDASDDTIISTTIRNTALRYIFNGAWSHCWLEHDGSNTNTRKNNALAANALSYADYIIVILNEPGFGGCNRGPRDIVQTRSISWQVVGHEAGHGIGGLRDEYSRPGTYSGGTINNSNCSSVLNRNTVFWNRYIDPAIPVPTTFSAGMDSNRTVGEFEGCSYNTFGIYRPVNNCRMRGNTPNFGPVCQTLMRGQLHGNLGHNFYRAVAGDFNGDGRDDVLIQNSGDWAIYRASNSPRQLDRVWTANNRVPGRPGVWASWPISSTDQLHVADFNGDGMDDIVVLNRFRWSRNYVVLLMSNGTGLETQVYYSSIPGYGYIGNNDKIFIADFNGDYKSDFYLFSGSSYGVRYIAMVRSTGTALATIRRYDNYLPSWAMRNQDRYFVADFDGDNKDDLYVSNTLDWGPRYLQMFRSSGSGLSFTKRYTTSLPGWTMTTGDRFFAGDFNGDNKDDLYVFNGSNWSFAYLLMARSTGSGLTFTRRYNDGSGDTNNIPGWQMRKGDRFFISDANRDGREDLFVYNPKINWGHEYLGTLMSSGNTLSGSWSEDWVLGIPGAGGWNLGKFDQIIPVNYEGGTGRPDIFIRNRDWFGLIQRGPSRFSMNRHYNQWIYSPLYDKTPWSTTLP